MIKTLLASIAVVAVPVLVTLATVHAADPAVNCEASKLKETGKYGNCRLKAESKSVKKGEAPDYSKCDAKLSEKFGKADTKWGAECPTTGDAAAIQSQVTGDADDLTGLLSGEGLFVGQKVCELIPETQFNGVGLGSTGTSLVVVGGFYVNDQGPGTNLHFAPGQLQNLRFQWVSPQSTYCPTCVTFVQVLRTVNNRNPELLGCLHPGGSFSVNGQSFLNGDGASGNSSFYITAPSEPGDVRIALRKVYTFTCDQQEPSAGHVFSWPQHFHCVDPY